MASSLGRRCKLSKQVIESICEGIRGGLTQEQAALKAGIHESTFYRWVKRGQRAKSGLFCQFCEELKRAQIDARQIHLDRISKASEGKQTVHERRLKHDAAGNVLESTTITKTIPPQWQASAWILERRFPEEFGKHIQPGRPEEHDPLDTWIESLKEAQKQFGDLNTPDMD